MSKLIIDTEEFPGIIDDDIGDELEIHLTGIVRRKEAIPIDASTSERRVTLPGPIEVEILVTAIDHVEAT